MRIVRRVKTLSLTALALLLTLSVACADDTPAPVAPTPLAAPPVVAPLVADDDAPPALRLPTEPRPTSESVVLDVDPRQERTFSGSVEIHLVATRPHRVVWLSARDLRMTDASVQAPGRPRAAAIWEALGETGTGKLTFAETMPPGELTLRIAFEGKFAQGQRGLYRVTEAGTPYAFTQFEATSARYAFPCFDEPSFKIPFTTTLVVPKDQIAIANTREVSREPAGNNVRVTFATSPPIPSYLVAFAVGPFDVVPAADVPANAVRTRPVPLRAITPHGRAKDIAYALAHTGEILATLEQYFGIEYPYDKLDILAVPGKGGAMENAGAVTFAESLVLMDEATASVRQRKNYASVMAHELAHQWTGDLVTMQWWDDTWLNEAFATWMAAKAADAWDPKLHMGLSLLRGIQGAMSADSVVSARSIRQPIESSNDIENAFDTITYQKGAGVLAMFERWAGADAWQKGVHEYLVAHRFGNATADDFLDAENRATGKDVKSAFRTFLDQPGVPLLTATLACPRAPSAAATTPDAVTRARIVALRCADVGGPDCPPVGSSADVATLRLEQARFLPLGSTGDPHKTWQLPVCASTPGQPPAERTQHCTLLSGPSGTLDVDQSARCPAWVLPNADAAGYYRFSLDPADLARLRNKGLPGLSAREKMAYATSLRTAYSLAKTPTKDVFDALAPLAKDPDPIIAEEPMGFVSQARDWLYETPVRVRVEAYAARLYAPALARLGWQAKKGEDDETRALRGSVLGFLASTARDPAVTVEAKKRGTAYLELLLADAGLPPLHATPVTGADRVAAELAKIDRNLAGVQLAVVGEQADGATWDAMKALLLRSVDEVVRGQVLWGMGLARDSALAARARQLVLDPALRETEVLSPLYAQLQEPDRREEIWAWEKANYDAITARLPKHRGGLSLVGSAHVFCDEAHAAEVLAFFTPRIDAIEGGKRVLASTVEDIKLCAARRKVHEPAARTLFGGLGGRGTL